MVKTGSTKRISFHFSLQKDREKVVHVDPAIHELLGYKANDFIEANIHLADLFHSDDQDILSELFSLVPQDTGKNINFRCRQASGKIICLQASYQKQFDKDSNTLKLQISLIDAKTLAKSLDDQSLTMNFAAMMENTDDYIYFKDHNHVFTGASQTLVELTDPSEHWRDLIGKTDYDVFPETYADDYYQLEKQVFSGQIKVAHEVQKTLDIHGNEGWVDNRKYPIKDKSGNIIGLFGIARDITESKQLEESLLASEQRFYTIFNEAPLGVAVIDSLNGHIYDANPAYAKIAGRSIEELRTLDWMKITHPDEMQEDLDNMALMNAGEIDSFSMQKRFIQPDKSIRWINMTIARMQVSDKSEPRHLSMTEDITQSKSIEIVLQQSEERFRTIFHEAPLGVAVVDSLNGHIYDANPAYVKIAGRPIDELRTLNWMKITHPDDIQQDLDNMARMNAGATDGFTMEKRYIQPDESIRWINMTIAPMQVADISKPRHLCMTEDITQRKNTEEQLKLAETVFQNTEQGILIANKDNLIVAVNPAFTMLTGYSPLEVIGRDPKLLQSGRHDKRFYHQLWQSLESTGRWQGEIWNKKKNGTECAEHLSINTIYDEKGEVFQRVSLFLDITDKKSADEKIWYQANFDSLTELPNRSMFRDRLEHDIKVSQRTKKPLALLFLDLDHFKEVNDTLGHEKGDQLLVEVAQRIRGCVRESDTVARLSGDEFTVILTELDDPLRVERIAEDIIRSLSTHFLLDTEKAYISASIGVSLYPNDSDKIDNLIKSADQAMYMAKENGRNQFSFFTRSMQLAANDHSQLTIDLRFAIKDQQFQLYYQPILDLQTQKIIKAEALIRWNHPIRGLLYPSDFTPLAEESGLIVEIGNWVFQQAAKQVKDWQGKIDPNFQISVNKSTVEFRSATNYLKWIDCLKQLAIKQKSIVFDVTEDLLIKPSETVKKQLLELSNNDIQLAIDDFGIGCSALSSINEFKIDYLKIDSSLVKQITPESSELIFCETIIFMAHKFSLKVIAEGIETEEQKQLLINAGCDYGQGFWFSKPVSVECFEKLLIIPG